MRQKPFLGCDGTFSTVNTTADNLHFELTSIAAKDLDTGRMYSVMGELATRKTVVARKVLFDYFLRKLNSYGLEDPLGSSPSHRVSFSTDFETTFGISFCQALCQTFRPHQDMAEIWESYFPMVCFSCDVHEKRAILKKVTVTENHCLFFCAVGTRLVTHSQQVDDALTCMHDLGGQWATFEAWLNQNKVAHVLWFQVFHKQGYRAHPQQLVLWRTNGNEAMHSLIKRNTDYLITNGRGLPALELVQLLEKMDNTDLENFIALYGVQFTTSPLWKRPYRNFKRKSQDGKVCIDGDIFQVSELKRRKH